MRVIWVAATASAVFALDQASKLAAMRALSDADVSRIELMPFVTLVRAFNRGVNFGLFASDAPWQPFALAALAVAVSVALAVWALRTADRPVAAGCALLIGGALGNAVDRAHVGAVIDFINVDCCGIGNPYAFNVADTAIFLGAVLILWATWRDNPRETNAARR